MANASNHSTQKEKIMSKELIVVIPVYNEEQIIKEVIQDWVTTLRKLGIDFEIRVYNDGSKDATLAQLNESAEEHKELTVIDKVNGGHGPTILQGYRDADAEFVFQVDSDNEMRGEFFADLWNQRESSDLVIGRRKFTFEVPIPRRVVSYIAKKSVLFFYGRGISDVNAPYRLMRKEAFADIFEAIPIETFAPNVIVSGMAVKNKLRIKDKFVPTDFRATGTVSIQRMKLLKVAMKSFRETILFARQHKK